MLMQEEILLAFIVLLTSGMTAITGMGGGMLLIAILPTFLPAHILIPIHGVTQLTSNISRAFLGYKDIYYKALLRYFIGSLLGVSISYNFFLYVSFSYIPLFIGMYIILSLWSRTFSSFIEKFDNYFILGFVQSGFALLVGVTGAMSIPKLMRDCKDSNQVIITAAVLSATTHLLKIIVFIILGFAFFDHIYLMLYMSIGAIIGSYLGTFLRTSISQKKLLVFMKVLLTFFAIKSILTFIINV